MAVTNDQHPQSTIPPAPNDRRDLIFKNRQKMGTAKSDGSKCCGNDALCWSKKAVVLCTKGGG